MTCQPVGASGDRALRLLWGVEPAPARGPKARWSIADVAARAVGVADRGGLESVTLANVAAELGVTTGAVYRYVDSKDILVELMVDAAAGDPPPLTGETWDARAREWVWALRDRYRQHPWMADVRPSGMPRQPRPFAWIDTLVLALADREDIDGMRVALLLEGLVRTYSAIAQGLTARREPAAWLGMAVADRFPALAMAADRDWANADAELDYAIEVVLRGIATTT